MDRKGPSVDNEPFKNIIADSKDAQVKTVTSVNKRSMVQRAIWVTDMLARSAQLSMWRSPIFSHRKG